MNKSTNQKHITIHQKSTDGERYTITLISALEEARASLSGYAFKLWTYFAQNMNGYSFGLYPNDANKRCGFTGMTLQNAFNELIAEGYLIQNTDNSLSYDFYVTPQRKKEDKASMNTMQTYEEYWREHQSIPPIDEIMEDEPMFVGAEPLEDKSFDSDELPFTPI